MGKVICFSNNKGGVGKTTSLICVAEAFAKMNRRVLCVDLDSQANLTGVLSKTPSENRILSIRDFFLDKTCLSIEPVAERIALIPSDLNLGNFDIETAGMHDRVHLLSDLLEDIKDDYDFVLIDCPPALSTITFNAFVASDYLVMVATPDDLSYKGLKMTYKLYQEVLTNKRFNPNLKIAGTIVTKYENNLLSNTYLKKISNDPLLLFIPPAISKATKVGQATAMKRSIYEFDPAGKPTKQYLEVAQTLALRILTDQPE